MQHRLSILPKCCCSQIVVLSTSAAKNQSPIGRWKVMTATWPHHPLRHQSAIVPTVANLTR